MTKDKEKHPTKGKQEVKVAAALQEGPEGVKRVTEG